MKRRGLIAVLATMLVMMSAAACFADEDAFALKSSYPKDGQEDTSVENVGVKLYFNHSISGSAAKKNNKNCVKIVDEKGKAIPVKILTADDDSGLLLVLGDNTNKKFKVDNNANYKLVISKDFMDDQGRTLGREKTVTFKTFNQKLNMIVNMVMMVVMFGGIMFVTIRQQRNKSDEKKADKEKEAEAAFNPYREAKRTGRSVEEVIAEEEKRRLKAEKRAKKKGREKQEEVLEISELLPYVYKVHAPKPIAKAGGRYKSGRRRKQEAAVKREQSNTRKRTGGKK